MALAAVNTVGLEFGTALTYPADEAAVAGILECAAELFGFLFVCIGGRILSPGDDDDDVTIAGGQDWDREDEAIFVFFSVLALGALTSLLLILFTKLNVTRPS